MRDEIARDVKRMDKKGYASALLMWTCGWIITQCKANETRQGDR